MASLVEMAKEMVVARASTTPVTTEEMMNDLERFYTKLKKLEAGEVEAQIAKPEEEAQAEQSTLTIKEAFKKNEVRCMICGKGGFKTLARHLTTNRLWYEAPRVQKGVWDPRLAVFIGKELF